jgi:UDP-glucose 4-epimerase
MVDSRRILINGLSTQWGGRLAQSLERDRAVEAIVGIDAADPRHELHRTEFVRIDAQPVLLKRIIHAAQIDTVVDTRMVSDPIDVPREDGREAGVIGTINLLTACGGSDSPVSKLVFKSSAHYYGCEPDDPAFFTEEMERVHPPRTPLERDVLRAEEAVAEFGARNPATTVTVLRMAGAIGAELRSSYLSLLNLPLVPTILGFDPRHQFIHEDDIVGALEHAVRHEIPGTFNAAADGVLALSEVISTLGKQMVPILPPWGTSVVADQLRRLGLKLPAELVREMRYGRGLDNRRLKSTGFSYRYTSREAVLKLRAQQRLRPLLRSGEAPYQYEREVEEFLRWSPSVQSAGAPARTARAYDGHERVTPFAGYDDLTAAELLELIPSLDALGLSRLRAYEAAGSARSEVLAALDRNLARKGLG